MEVASTAFPLALVIPTATCPLRMSRTIGSAESGTRSAVAIFRCGNFVWRSAGRPPDS
jgi:hypothetical protein